MQVFKGSIRLIFQPVDVRHLLILRANKICFHSRSNSFRESTAPDETRLRKWIFDRWFLSRHFVLRIEQAVLPHEISTIGAQLLDELESDHPHGE